MYSKIPMPHFELNDEDARFAIAYLPLVGGVIALIVYCALRVLYRADLPVFVTTMIITAIPLILTGGFHADGYLDTKDAIGSYLPIEKKLEILKDPHTGAAAVTGYAVCILLFMSGIGVIADSHKASVTMASVFVISRALSSITSQCFQKARHDGMLAAETKGGSRARLVIPVVFLVIALAAAASESVVYTGVIVVVFTVFALFYKRMTIREFGGVTGDTAGYFVVAGQTVAIDAIALTILVMSRLGG